MAGRDTDIMCDCNIDCVLCGDEYGCKQMNGMCPDCWQHADCQCGLEKL